jgi:hypothetical protein
MTERRISLPLPSDVDLSDLPFMPLHDKRLVKSRAWLQAKNWRGGGPGLGFCLFNLWVEAFRSVPAGSLEDDDDMLADQARCDIEFWTVIRDKALRGWEKRGGRLWHPVIAELAWDLWLQRLKARHEKALDSHRAAAKRATDAGRMPPDPPGGFHDWMGANYPASFAYQAALVTAQARELAKGNPPDNPENRSDIVPKRSEGKGLTPLTPQQRQAEGPERRKDGQEPGGRKRWFTLELTRLENEFRPMLPVMLSQLQRPNAQGKFVLVETFKNCWVERGVGDLAVIVAPSKARVNKIIAEHGAWMRQFWPDLQFRHARVDELRRRECA